MPNRPIVRQFAQSPLILETSAVTASQLLSYILSGILLQILVLAGVAVWRRHTTLQAPTAIPVAPPADSQRDLAWAGHRGFRVLRREIEDPAGSQCSFYLAPMDGKLLAPFKSGQFLTFQLQVAGCAQTNTKPQIVTRCYSLSDRPEATHFRITVKRVPAPHGMPGLPPGVSSNHFHDQVQPGDVLQVKAPSGHFYLDTSCLTPVVLIGGGIGITPMMSMLRWCLARQPERTVHLFYGLRSGREHAFKSVLEQFAADHPQLHLHVVYSQPGPDDLPGRDYRHHGHVDVALLRQQLPLGAHQFYICGPASMMESLVPALAAWGVPLHDIHFEAFGPASVRLPSTAAPPTLTDPVAVRFARSQRTLPWDGEQFNLLDFAERHGVVVESGCRSGGCGACQTRLLKGVVRYANPPDHDPAPGHCLLCVATPGSDLELEA